MFPHPEERIFMLKRFYLVFGLSFFLFGYAMGQEVFYEVEQSGINAGYSLFKNHYTSGKGAKLSAVLSGSYIAYGEYIKSDYASFDPDLNGGETEDFDFGLALLLPSSILERVPTYYSLLFIDFGRINFLSGALNGLSANVLHYGVSFNKKLNHKNNFLVIPFVTAGFFSVSRVGKAQRDKFSKLSNHYYMGGGVHFGYLKSHWFWPSVKLFANYSEQYMTYGLTLSVSVGKLKRKKYF